MWWEDWWDTRLEKRNVKNSWLILLAVFSTIIYSWMLKSCLSKLPESQHLYSPFWDLQTKCSTVCNCLIFSHYKVSLESTSAGSRECQNCCPYPYSYFYFRAKKKSGGGVKAIAIGPTSTKTCLKAQSRYDEAQNQPTPKAKKSSNVSNSKTKMCDLRF